MKQAEALTYQRGVPSFDLMKKAGIAVAGVVQEKWESCRVLVLCGPGNNGGDGFIAAEELRNAGWEVVLAAMRPAVDMAGDAAMAAKNWKGKTIAFDEVSFFEVDLVVDALFGTGLQKNIDGVVKDVIDKLNQSKLPVIAVDLPSGVNGDTGEVMGGVPKAVLTVTFFRKKYGHLLMPGREICGEILVEDIGISDDVLSKINPQTVENDISLWRDCFPMPRPEGHKYDRGHALIYGGDVMTGAARLAARAAQRIGAGLVTVGAPQVSVQTYSESLESAIVHSVQKIGDWGDLLKDPKRNAVLIGPGLGLGQAQKNLVLTAVDTGKLCVLDADALSNFSDAPDELISCLHDKCVLTPHEGEFARLFGKKLDMKRDKLSRAQEAAKIANCVVLLKGPDTVIANPHGYAVINSNAPPWLATAGAGDVLAGIILGLASQGMPVFWAAAAGAWVHGSIAADFGPGLIAEDLTQGIPPFLRRLSDSSKNDIMNT